MCSVQRTAKVHGIRSRRQWIEERDGFRLINPRQPIPSQLGFKIGTHCLPEGRKLYKKMGFKTDLSQTGIFNLH
jgi:hypothetical protein